MASGAALIRSALGFLGRARGHGRSNSIAIAARPLETY